MPGGFGALDTRDYLLQQYGLKSLEIKDYKSTGEPLKTGITDDRPQLVLPESEQFSINPDQKSMLGTPVFCDLKIKYGNLELYLDTVIIEISQSVIIKKTTLPGRKGTVKEYITQGDWIADIKGAIVSGDKSFPEDQSRLFKSLIDIPDALEVISPFLQLYEIYSIVIEDKKIPSPSIDTQTFQLSCLSDTPLELLEDDQTIG